MWTFRLVKNASNAVEKNVIWPFCLSHQISVLLLEMSVWALFRCDTLTHFCNNLTITQQRHICLLAYSASFLAGCDFTSFVRQIYTTGVNRTYFLFLFSAKCCRLSKKIEDPIFVLNTLLSVLTHQHFGDQQ